MLTQGCRHSTPEPPWHFSVVQTVQPERPLATLVSFLASVSAAPPRPGQGPGPLCSIVSPPAPPVRPQARRTPLQTSLCSLQGPGSPSRKPGPSLQSWPKALAGLYRSQIKAQELRERQAGIAHVWEGSCSPAGWGSGSPCLHQTPASSPHRETLRAPSSPSGNVTSLSTTTISPNKCLHPTASLAGSWCFTHPASKEKLVPVRAPAGPAGEQRHDGMGWDGIKGWDGTAQSELCPQGLPGLGS